MFKNRLLAGGLKFRLENGQAVVIKGSINVYTAGGTYSILCETIEKEGLGELFARFEKLKSDLEAEGLFAEAHKKPLPKYIRTLGVITSRNGAVLHDICTVTARRNPYVHIVLAEASVQGKGAADTLVRALNRMILRKPDVIIIGRGGGSFEDLFEFNDERLARQIYDCPIPVISAVGHETDFTICDFVADKRAATPSVAAELAVFDYFDLQSRLVDYEYELYALMKSKIDRARSKTREYKLMIEKADPGRKLKSYSSKLPLLRNMLDEKIREKIRRSRHNVLIYAERLDGFSPLKKLKSGFVYLEEENGRSIKSISEVQIGQRIRATLQDGMIEAEVESITCKKD